METILAALLVSLALNGALGWEVRRLVRRYRALSGDLVTLD